MIRFSTFLVLVLPAVSPVAIYGDEATESPAVDYLRDVKPILAANCYRCHGPDEQESGLRLDSGATALEGGNAGPALVPGKSAESLLIQAVTGASDEVSRMPPEDEAEALSAENIGILRRWIDGGAAFPESEDPAPPAKFESDHWSFQPIRRPPLPAVTNSRWMRTPVDAFILARLEERGIAPSPAADRATLIRRLSLDLVGLPPSPAEVDQFVRDARPDAYERLVDRLLSSPRYGERWGRHWLDQARYADSDGYTNDVAREMWRYRDWVIDAVNRDAPFDQFTIEQFAGDMLPEATLEQQIATGFHRNTQRNREGGSDAEQYRVEAVVDRVSTTGVVFLGLTLGCARCHDHKYDPISQREFYEIFAFLNNQDEPQITVPLESRLRDDLQAVQQQVAAANKELLSYDAANAPRQAEWEAEIVAKINSPAGSDIDADLAKVLSVDGKERTEEQRRAVAAAFQMSDPERIKLAERLDNLKKRESALLKQTTTTTLVMKELAKPRQAYIHLRGEFLRKGKSVDPYTPRVLPPLPEQVESPNRLDFARWLVADDNPLTPRVTVNRSWLHFFGVGIVETENDFGQQGALPTHPELLDWLASEFIESGWSMKRLHRLIVNSAVYRQSSHMRPELAEIDAKNALLARQNRVRLEAEVIRDSALEAAGLLSAKVKGPSVFPPQPEGVMKMTRNPNRKWVVSTGEDRFRRGMYTYFWRSTPHPFLKLFNAPESNTTCTRRDRSNTPLQALTLLNDEAFVEAAQALAVRVLSEGSRRTADENLEHLFELALARRPEAAEFAALRDLLAAELADPASVDELQIFPGAQRHAAAAGVDPQQLAAWATVARAVLNLDEFITRE